MSSTSGTSPLAGAVEAGDLDSAKLLLEGGADVNDTDGNGHTPLIIAVREGDFNMTELLLQSGADVNDTNRNEHTPLFIAVGAGSSEMTKLSQVLLLFSILYLLLVLLS